MTPFDERFLNVDRYGCLRTPLPLWLGLVFMARHWSLLIVTLASVRRAPESVALAYEGLSWVTLVMEVPVLLLIVGALFRRPESGQFWRTLWRHGLKILWLTLMANAVYLATHLLRTPYWGKGELAMASCLLLDMAIAFGSMKSPYIRQVFLEFPASTPSGDAARRES